MKQTPTRLARRFVPALLLFGAACSDRTPLTGNDLAAPEPLALRLECTARVLERAITCGGALPQGGARGDLLVGTPYVKLPSTTVAFSAGTLSADVTVQNLMDQPIGTTDGVNADSSVRVFFHTGPATTGGSGNVQVANPDGV